MSRRPYIPLGCDLQGRLTPTQQRGQGLLPLLLSTGAVSGPHRPTRPLTVSLWRRLLRRWRVWATNRRQVVL